MIADPDVLPAPSFRFSKVVFWLAIVVGLATLLEALFPLSDRSAAPMWRWPLMVALLLGHAFVAIATILLIARLVRRPRSFRRWNGLAIVAGVLVTLPVVWALLQIVADPFG